MLVLELLCFFGELTSKLCKSKSTYASCSIWLLIIDKALSEITNGEDFVQAMADIYEHAEVRKEFGNLPSWIQNIITVIDYDTELAMNGLDFKSYKNVIEALTDMGLIEEAKVLTAFENDSSQENTDIYYYNLALNNDYESFWDKVYSYADQNIKR